METIDVLRGARALLTPEGAFCRDWIAVDSRGAVVSAGAPTACSWCVVGAVARVSDGLRTPFNNAMDTLYSLIGEDVTFAMWSLSHNQADALDLFDRAIAKIESGGAS
jgi:hypothetical protein